MQLLFSHVFICQAFGEQFLYKSTKIFRHSFSFKSSYILLADKKNFLMPNNVIFLKIVIHCFYSYLLTVFPSYLCSCLREPISLIKTDLITVCMTFIMKRTWMIGFCVAAIRTTALGINSPTAKTCQS